MRHYRDSAGSMKDSFVSLQSVLPGCTAERIIPKPRITYPAAKHSGALPWIQAAHVTWSILVSSSKASGRSCGLAANMSFKSCLIPSDMEVLRF